MRAAGILLLAFGGLTLYWVITGKGSSGGTPTQVISSPLNSIGGLAGQGTSTLQSTGQAPPGDTFTPPAPVPPDLNTLERNTLLQLQGLGQPSSSVTAVDPTLNQLIYGP